MTHYFLNPLRAAAIASACMLGTAAFAQDVTFQIDNSFSLEQVITSQNYTVSQLQAEAALEDSQQGSNSVIVQNGSANQAETNIFDSSNALAGIVQEGNENTAFGIITDSPGSTIAQLQVGNNNSSLVGIVGGENNGVATLQIGNNLGVAVGLVDSVDTKIVYGQAGNDYNGGIVIKNAPAGTVIRFN